MSQISPQDVQLIQQLVSVIVPKIIERLKTVEGQTSDIIPRISTLEEQVKLLHSGAPKAERAKRGSKKKEPEVPQLISEDENSASQEIVDASYTPVQETPAGDPLVETNAAATGNVNGTVDAGTVAVIQNDVNETGIPLSGQNMLPEVGADKPLIVVEGITITGQLVYGVHYIIQQGYGDPTIIAQALQTPVAVVQTILNMPIEEQNWLMEQWQASQQALA